MKVYYQYGLKWRYEFKNSESGVVTFDEIKTIDSKLMHDRTWMLGDTSIDGLHKHEKF